MAWYWSFLSSTGAVAFIGYCASRFAERRALTRLPPAAELFEVRLHTVYRWATWAMRARCRQRRKTKSLISLHRFALVIQHTIRLFTMRVLGVVPVRSWRGLRAARMLELATKWLDDVVDGDQPPSDGKEPQDLFDHVTRVGHGFANLPCLGERALSEDLPLAWLVRATRRFLGFDVLPDMLEIWENYTPDARRTLEGQPITDQATLMKAHDAYRGLRHLAGRMVGLSEKQAWLFAELTVESGLALDRLRDFLRDARKRQIAIPAEELIAAGIDADELLLHAASWQDLATVPGVSDWYIAEATRCIARWEAVLPSLMKDVLPYVKPLLLSRQWRDAWGKRAKLFERRLKRWEVHVTSNLKEVANEGIRGVLQTQDLGLGGTRLDRLG